MVRGTIVGIDRDGTQARHQVLGNEDEVTAVRRLPILPLVHPEGVRMRLAGMRGLPRVYELRCAVDKSLQEATAQRIVRRHVEVAADERALRMRQRLVGAVAFTARGFKVRRGMQLAQAL